jgi:hypothetical protein
MGSADQAANIPGAEGDGTNDSTVLYISAANTSYAAKLPKSWQGKYCRITTKGENVFYLFGTTATTTVDRTVAASADGNTDPTLPDELFAGSKESVQIPHATDDAGDVYFVNQSASSAATGKCRLVLG